jgi:hypothetical protein
MDLDDSSSPAESGIALTLFGDVTGQGLLLPRVLHEGFSHHGVLSCLIQHKGVAHTAAMPEGLAEFFIKAACPADGVVVDPFAGGATTVVVGRKLGRQAGGVELHEEFVKEGLRRIAAGLAEDTPGRLVNAMGV